MRYRAKSLVKGTGREGGREGGESDARGEEVGAEGARRMMMELRLPSAGR